MDDTLIQKIMRHGKALETIHVLLSITALYLGLSELFGSSINQKKWKLSTLDIYIHLPHV